MDKLIQILHKEGFSTVYGKDAVLKKIKELSNDKKQRLCSGFGVFPDGGKCYGCSDCQPEDKKDAI